MATDNSIDLIDPAEAEQIAEHVLSLVDKTAQATVNVTHEITVRTNFARNEVQTMEREITRKVRLALNFNGQAAEGKTTRLDPEGLADLVQTTETGAKFAAPDELGLSPIKPPRSFTDPPIYFESTLEAGGSEFQGDLIRNAATQARNAGLTAAGSIQVTGNFLLVKNSLGFRGHTRNTYGEMSMTARAKDGKSSGWAWSGGEDFARAVDPKAIVAKAIDLCQRSKNPLAVEPGRYTVILEPEATAQFMMGLIGSPAFFIWAHYVDAGFTAYSKEGGGNKLGLTVTDNRVDLLYDPMDPNGPFSPLAEDGYLYKRTHWIERGVLKNLAVIGGYGKHMKPPQEELQNPMRARIAVGGPTQSLEEMIASTKRGIWVHHFRGMGNPNKQQLLLTGVTADGTFLIENGKITRPIKNLRFLESPLFMLNKVDAWGDDVRASENMVVPRLKVHDFEFTSMSDAV